MDLSALQSLLAAMAGVRVACVGDVMLDLYIYGEVERISPEAPIPVLRRTHERGMLGAVGNVARNVAALGGWAQLGAELGTDQAAGEVLGLIREEPRVSPFLAHIEDAVTTVKTRFVAAGQQLLRVDDEDANLLDFGLREPISLAFADARAILISDYAKGVVTESFMKAAFKAAERTGAPIIVDPKGRDFARYGPVDLIKPNLAELAAAFDFPVGSDDEVEATCHEALDGCSAKAILVTRGGNGMTLVERDLAARHFPARRREVFDVSGAGDTSLAALGLALAAGASLDEAVELAVLASGVAVSKPGTAVVTPMDLTEAVMAEHLSPAEAKIATLDAAARQAERWREQGLRVGFTNGCFDILHRGHVAYLAQARAWCDRLVLGLNTDASVARLKGPERPVNDLESRALMLGALAGVDLITPFDEDTPMRLIQAIRPDVLVKGADYTEAEVVGAAEVRGWGGVVRLAPLVDGHSTTAVIARLKERGIGSAG